MTGTQRTVDPDEFFTNADHDGDMDLSCPACPHWSVVVPQASSIRQQRAIALAHIAEAHAVLNPKETAHG